VGDFGVGGDSGAWIVSNVTGQVAGHVLAERTGLTYICAMHLLFEDIQQTLSACRISLPGADAAIAGVDPMDASGKKAAAVMLTTMPTRKKVGSGGDDIVDGRKRFYQSSASRAREKSKVSDAAVVASKARTMGWWSQSVSN